MTQRDLYLDMVLLNNGIQPQAVPQAVPMVAHPITGQPLGVPAVIMMIPGDIMTAIGEVVRKVVQEELAAWRLGGDGDEPGA